MIRNKLKIMMIGQKMMEKGQVEFEEEVKMKVERWRKEDMKIWKEKIIKEFEEKNKGIKINLEKREKKEYNVEINEKIDDG